MCCRILHDNCIIEVVVCFLYHVFGDSEWVLYTYSGGVTVTIQHKFHSASYPIFNQKYGYFEVRDIIFFLNDIIFFNIIMSKY